MELFKNLTSKTFCLLRGRKERGGKGKKNILKNSNLAQDVSANQSANEGMFNTGRSGAYLKEIKIRRNAVNRKGDRWQEGKNKSV